MIVIFYGQISSCRYIMGHLVGSGLSPTKRIFLSLYLAQLILCAFLIILEMFTLQSSLCIMCFLSLLSLSKLFTFRTELGLDSMREAQSIFHEGEVVKCRVIGASPASRKINLSFVISPKRYSWSTLFTLSVRLKFMSSGIQKFSANVNDYRNFSIFIAYNRRSRSALLYLPKGIVVHLLYFYFLIVAISLNFIFLEYINSL